MMRLLVIFFVISLFFSCSTDNKNYLGQWEVIHNEKLKKILIISNDSISLYRVSLNDCDTFFHKEMLFPIIKIQTNDNTIKLTIPIEEDTTIWTIKMIGDKDGELCLNNKECASINKSNYNLVLDPEKSKLRHLSYLIEIDILQTERDCKKLKEDIEMSKNAHKLIQYIDTLKAELMNSYGLNYSEIKCWANLDSLASYKTASIFIIGNDPANPKDDYLSGVRLENKLLNYFKTLPPSINIKTIFPYYKDGEFYCHNEEDGFVENWAVHKFFHITLGKTIVELNRIQLNIIQLERISKTHN